MYTNIMNIIAHATSTYHAQNDSAMHWIQTDGVKYLLIAFIVVALYFGIKKLIDSKTK